MAITKLQISIDGTGYTSILDYADLPLHLVKTVDQTIYEKGTLTLTFPVNVQFSTASNGLREKPFIPYTKLRIGIDSVDYDFTILDDDVQQEGGIFANYVHTVQFANNIKKLEGYYTSHLRFTKPLQDDIASASDYYTYKTAIERVFAITPLRLSSDNTDPLFELDEDTAAILDKIEFPQIEVPSWNLYEFIMKCAANVGAIPYMDDYTTVKFRFINESTSSANIVFNRREASRSAAQYCTNIDTVLSNVVVESSDDESLVVYPAINAWVGYRPKENSTRMEDTNSIIELPSANAIIKPVHIYCKVTYNTIGTYIVDLVDYCLEETIYNTLDRTEKSDYIFYTQYGNKIDGIFYTYDYPVLGSSTYALSNILIKAMYAQHEKVIVWDGGELIEGYVRNAVFQIHYVPNIDNVRVQVERKKSDLFPFQFSIAANQNESQVSSEAFGDYLGNSIQRMGNERLKLSLVASSLSGLHDIGDYYTYTDTDGNTQRYVITQRAILIYLNMVEIEYILDGDYAAVSERIGLNAAPRVTEFEKKYSNRCDIYKEYCVLSDAPETFNTQLSYTTRNRLLYALDPTTLEDYNTVINNAIIETSSSTLTKIQASGQAILLPVHSIGFDRNIEFNFSFPDNISAGRKIVADGSDKYAEDVFYVNRLGKFVYMHLYLLSGLSSTLSDGSALPQIATSYISATPDAEFENFIMYKDNQEAQGLTYQLGLSANSGLVFGEGLIKYNPLVTPIKSAYVLIEAENRYNYNTLTLEYQQSDTGLYLKYNNGYYSLLAIGRRFNYDEVEEEYVVATNGDYLKCSRETKLVYCTEYLQERYKGKVPWSQRSIYAINLSVSETELCVYFGSDIEDPPTFSTSNKSWAIVDEKDRLILGGNSNTLNPVYMNFKKEL